MNATELMIGNWVNCILGMEQVVDVMCDSINTKNSECIPYDWVAGIPLTPEILVNNCGCHPHPENTFYHEGILLETDENGIYFKHGRYVSTKRYLQYVHEAQILFTALGSPLNIEL